MLVPHLVKIYFGLGWVYKVVVGVDLINDLLRKYSFF